MKQLFLAHLPSRITALVISTVFLTPLLMPLSVAALSGPDITDILNGHTYFKPSDAGTTAAPTCAAGTPPAAVASGKLFMIGDSITARSQNELSITLGAKGFSPVDIDGVASRRLSTGMSPLDGLTVLNNDKTRYADAKIIVVALGTNSAITLASITAVMNTINTNNPNMPKVYWVNVGVKNSDRQAAGLATIDYATEDALLNDYSSQGYTPIDWANVVNQHPEYIDKSDHLGVHPTVAGQQVFADTIANGITGATPVAGGCGVGGGATVLKGNDNERKIWNFLTVTKGLSGISAAALMGNIQNESGFRPDIIEGGATAPANYVPVNNVGFGIAQWTNTSRQKPLEDLAATQNKPIIDLGVQLDYLWQELSTSYNNSVLVPLQATPQLDLRSATDVVLKKFECPRACVNVIQNPNPANIAAYQAVVDKRTGNAQGVLSTFGSN
jgi:hypothetical protein